MIAIAGGKGGCGKTTTALGLGRALAVAGVPARVADLDADMPNLHRLAGVERHAERGAGPGTLPEDLPTDEFGVEIVPPPDALPGADREVALGAVADHRGVTLLDCPAGVSPDAVAPLRSAAALVLVSTDRPESVEDAAKTATVARRLGVPVLGTVVTRTDVVPERVASTLGVERTVAIPDRAEPLTDPVVQDCYSHAARWVRDARTLAGAGRGDQRDPVPANPRTAPRARGP